MMTATTICSECRAECPAAATLCMHCGEALRGKECAQCRSRVREDAALCRWCGSKFSVPTSIDWYGKVRARRLASFFLRGRLLPQEVEVREENLILRSPGLFGLWVDEDEIPWNKIAGFNYRDGIFWDMVTVETRGQKASTIVGLAKADGRKIRHVLQGLEK